MDTEQFKAETGKSAPVVIAQFFGLKGKTAIDEIKALTPEDKIQLALGIHNGTLTY